jgi:hypothetical protein
MLERCEGKLSRTVLRGERRSNPPDLPDSRESKELLTSNQGLPLKETTGSMSSSTEQFSILLKPAWKTELVIL